MWGRLRTFLCTRTKKLVDAECYKYVLKDTAYRSTTRLYTTCLLSPIAFDTKIMFAYPIPNEFYHITSAG